MTDENREEWLGKAAVLLAEWLVEAGEEVPPLRISVGFPGGNSNRKRVVGQCWKTTASEDGINQIFISPVRGESETRNVLGTLLHEMIHAVDDCETGHRGNFARIAKALGFVAKLTSADNRTSELDERLDGLAERLGPFPHSALIPGTKGSEEPKTQTTRMIKLTCPDDGYVVRTTRKWLDIGTPSCPCGADLEEAS